ncbi:serine/threonine-protein kinase [Streptomyces sp. NPDC089799]|uniref:serine/threonine-protein kinase n=1 Tax=Streptomyces sp. NPDC089799 TaxID=3155066 RepID=UPI00342D1627
MEHSTAEGETLANRYRLVEPIGRGGMGKVWRAHDELLHRTVAVKELTAGLYVTEADRAVLHARTQKEARAAARIAHPAVVTVHDVFEHDDRPWIVMEYIDGPSLADAAKAAGRIEPREAARIGLHVLGALRAAHAVGVLHRDVKPGNVLLARDGRVLLTDFGIAAIEGDATITRTGELVGSIDYLAPERVTGGAPDPASDLWSLGATLYTAVEARSPFRRTSPISSLAAVVNDEPPPPRQAEALGPVITALLRKNPAQRPSAAEAERMLLEAMEGREPKAAQAFVPTQTLPAEDRDGLAADAPGGGSAAASGPAGGPGGRPGRPGPRPGRVPAQGSGPAHVSAHGAGPASGMGGASGAAGGPGSGTGGGAATTATAGGSGSGARSTARLTGSADAGRGNHTSHGSHASHAGHTGHAAQAGHPAQPGPYNTVPGPGAGAPAAPERRSGRLRRGAAVALVAALLGGGAAYGVITYLDAQDGKDSGRGGTVTGGADSGGADTGGADAGTKGKTGGDAKGQPAKTAPSGWHKAKDPAGFTLFVPNGWKRQTDGDQIDYTPDNGKHRIRISVDPTPDYKDPYAHLLDLEKQVSARSAYRKETLHPNTFQGTTMAALWEFSWQEKKDFPGPRRAIDQMYIGPDGKEYAIFMAGPAADWTTTRSQFDTALSGWQPASR